MSEEIIKIEHVSKEYRLGMIGGTTLRDELQRKSAKLRGKEDPTRKVTDTSTGNAGERFLALDDINLTINKGERVGIIGHNGAGKSTLLKLLSRITAPSRGSIELNGRIASMLEVGTGFHGELSGRENIYMNGAILGMSKAEIDSKMEDIIEFSECRQFIDTPVKRYSSGMYVKLAFSVAAHLDSEIMIMDEVLAVGDMQFQKKCLDKMSQVSQTEGRTILYVSHNMNTIRQLCDRCIVLDHGKMIFDGDVEKAIEKYLKTSSNSFNLMNTIDTIPDLHERYTGEWFIRKIHILNESNILSTGEKAQFKIELEIDDESIEKNVFLRIIVRANNGTIVTMATSEKRLNVTGEKRAIFIEFDTSILAPSCYSLTFVLYEIGEFGANRNIDVLRDIFKLEVVNSSEFNHGMKWETQWWGYCTSNNIKQIKNNNKSYL